MLALLKEKKWAAMLMAVLLTAVFNLALIFKEPMVVIGTTAVFLLLFVFYWVVFNRQRALKLLFFLVPVSFPFYLGMGANASTPSEPLALLLFLSLGVSLIRRTVTLDKLLKHPLAILVLIELVWMIITAFTSTLQDVSFKRVLIRMVYLGVYFVLGFELFKDNTKAILQAFGLYLLGMIYPIISAMIFHSQFDFVIAGSYSMNKPFYSDHTIYGAALAYMLPFVFVLFGKVRGNLFIKITAVLFYCTAFFLSYSRASWLSLMVALVVWALSVLRVKVYHLLMMLGLIVALVMLNRYTIEESIRQNENVSNKDVAQHMQSVTNMETDASNKERLNRWKCAWRMFEKKPLLGFGAGTYQFSYFKFQTQADATRISSWNGTKGSAHSEYLTALSEQGLIGFIIFFSLAVAAIHYALKVLYEHSDKATARALLMGMLTFLVHGFFNNFLDIDKIAMLFYLSLAAIIALDYDKAKSSGKV